MRVLVFGGDGQVGWEIRRLDGHAGHRVIAVPRREADITQPAEVMAAVRDAGAEVVVNPAAYTAVDRAETESELAFSVNRDGARNIAVACAKQSLPMIQISTDFVFDGSKQCAYAEDDPVGPLSVYGTSKEAGERAVRDTLDRHVILRTSWVFGALGQNLDLAAAILDLLSSMSEGRWGTYHYCGAGRTSWYGFAEEIFAQYRRITGAPAPRLRAITTAEFPTPATRPANSELDCSRFAAVFGFGPRPWRRGLAAVLDELLTE
jgi:dTDP-4-dehydrorhamnose reductase